MSSDDVPKGTPPSEFLAQRRRLAPDAEPSAEEDDGDAKFQVVTAPSARPATVPPPAVPVTRAEVSDRYRLTWDHGEGAINYDFDVVEFNDTDVIVMLALPQTATSVLSFPNPQPMVLKQLKEGGRSWKVNWCGGNLDFRSRGFRGIVLMKDNHNDDEKRPD